MSDTGDQKSRPDGKQPYSKPSVAWEEEMENRPSLMAACAKIAGMDATCDVTAGAS